LLHQAAQNGCIPVLKDLIDKGFDTEQLNQDDETPIFTAIRARKIEAVRVLVKAKANLNHTNSDEQTPLALAKSQNFSEAVKVLRAAGAKR
ncbi:MAG: ankyrin repeat domain-containing protein, partial [Turneriella sp.]|nr:ankyrin repeat domain-containing protein [Turneriella sp.]